MYVHRTGGKVYDCPAEGGGAHRAGGVAGVRPLHSAEAAVKAPVAAIGESRFWTS